MLFNSFEFLVFFIIVTTLYYALPHKYRWFLLLAASCFFYMAFIPIYIVILGATIVVDYYAGLYIEKLRLKHAEKYSKALLICSLVANIGVLAVFKYYNFFIGNISELANFAGLHANFYYISIALPIGLSLHTFQAMSYTIEVYRGNQKAERNFGIYALYVMFYPQLVAGPIERPQNVLHQYYEKKKFDYNNVTNGLKLMVWGLFKKVVIADRLATFTDPIFNHPHNYSAITLFIAAIFFSYQVFCDFSGYSDIALGSAQVMGFKLMKNFDKPYHSKSLAEFWKRWHISLSSWFKDYLYIPLGGSRVASISRGYFNIMFVFLLSGFWHGASWTFVFWGGLHGFYLVFAKIKDKWLFKVLPQLKESKPGVFRNTINIITTFSLVTIASIFFRSVKIQDAWFILKSFKNLGAEIVESIKHKTIIFCNNTVAANIDKVLIFSSFSFIILLEIIHIIQGNGSIREKLSTKPLFVRWAMYYSIVIVIIFFGVFNKREFIYFQF